MKIDVAFFEIIGYNIIGQDKRTHLSSIKKEYL